MSIKDSANTNIVKTFELTHWSDFIFLHRRRWIYACYKLVSHCTYFLQLINWKDRMEGKTHWMGNKKNEETNSKSFSITDCLDSFIYWIFSIPIDSTNVRGFCSVTRWVLVGMQAFLILLLTKHFNVRMVLTSNKIAGLNLAFEIAPQCLTICDTHKPKYYTHHRILRINFNIIFFVTGNWIALGLITGSFI